MIHTHSALSADPWSGALSSAGLGVRCFPAAGKVPAKGQVQVRVRVRGDTWGVYRERLLVRMTDLPPLQLRATVRITEPPARTASSRLW